MLKISEPSELTLRSLPTGSSSLLSAFSQFIRTAGCPVASQAMLAPLVFGMCTFDGGSMTNCGPTLSNDVDRCCWFVVRPFEWPFDRPFCRLLDRLFCRPPGRPLDRPLPVKADAMTPFNPLAPEVKKSYLMPLVDAGNLLDDETALETTCRPGN